MVYQDKKNPHDYCRVIYVPKAQIPHIEKPAPSDLPYINHDDNHIAGFYSGAIRTYARWPLSLHYIPNFIECTDADSFIQQATTARIMDEYQKAKRAIVPPQEVERNALKEIISYREPDHIQ